MLHSGTESNPDKSKQLIIHKFDSICFQGCDPVQHLCSWIQHCNLKIPTMLQIMYIEILHFQEAWFDEDDKRKLLIIKRIQSGEWNWSRVKVSVVQLQFGKLRVSGMDGSQPACRKAPPGRCCSCSRMTQCSRTCRWAGCDPVTTRPRRSRNGRWLPGVWRIKTFTMINNRDSTCFAFWKIV